LKILEGMSGAYGNGPVFDSNGTALTPQQIEDRDRRKGICPICHRTRTHNVGIFGRKSITNEDAHEGICIRCNHGSVPQDVLCAWQSRQSERSSSGAHRLRQAVNVVVNANNLMRPSRPVSPRRPVRPLSPRPLVTAQVTPSVSEYISTENLSSRTLLNHLKENREKGETGMLRKTLHGLRNLADDQAGGLSEIRETMHIYQNDSSLMMVAIGAVWAICSKSNERKEEARETGCLGLVLDSLRTPSTEGDAAVVYWALGTISCLAALDENKSFIADNGGVKSILKALIIHRKDPRVFEWGCRALYSMLHNVKDGDSPISSVRDFETDMVTFEDQNGIKVVANAMRNHESEHVAQWWALKVLSRVQDRNNPASAERVAKAIIEEGLGTTCVEIIKASSTSPELFAQAAETLTLMLDCSAYMSPLSATDCVPRVVRVVEENPVKIELHVSCARLFASIAREGSEAKRQISSTRALYPLVGSLAGAPEHLSLAKAVIDLLWVLSSDVSSFDYGILEFAKQAIEEASNRNPDDIDLHDAICGFVANISASGRGQAGSLPLDVLFRLSTNFPSRGTADQVYRALAAIYRAYPELTNLPTVSDHFHRLLEDMQAKTVKVQCSSSSALSAIACECDAAREMLYESGCLETTSAELLDTLSERLSQNLLQLISVLVTFSTKKVVRLPKGLIQSIIHAINSFPNLKKSGCSTIRNCMLAAVPGFRLVDTGLVNLLIGIIDDPTINDELAIEACGAIWAYTAKQPPSNHLERAQLYRSLLGLCGRHKHIGDEHIGDEQIEDNAYVNSPVMAEVAGALCCVMHSIKDNPPDILETDVGLIVDVLDIVIPVDVSDNDLENELLDENVEVLDRMLDVLLTLSFLAKDMIIQQGGIGLVIIAMDTFNGNEKIRQKGCSILALFASTGQAEVLFSIGEHGIDVCVHALEDFKNNVAIQTDACRALYHLSKVADRDMRDRISAQGGLMLLVNAITTYMDEINLVEAACSALENLSIDAEEQVLVDLNVVETVIAVMKRYSTSEKLQEKSLGVLKNVSMRSNDARRRIVDAGGIGRVAFAIKELMYSPAVLERALTIMERLAPLEDNQIVEEKGIQLIVNGMMANVSVENVQKHACACLRALSSNLQNQRLIHDLYGVNAIVYAMWAHYDSNPVLIEACRALSSLALNVEANEGWDVNEQEIRTIMSSMRRFPNSQELQEHACVALRNFLLSADNVSLVRPHAVELEELIHGAAKRFPDKCSDLASMVLANLLQ